MKSKLWSVFKPMWAGLLYLLLAIAFAVISKHAPSEVKATFSFLSGLMTGAGLGAIFYESYIGKQLKDINNALKGKDK